MDFLLRPFRRTKIVHTRSQALRKCCGCIHLRVGCALACVFWAAFSLYLTSVSFQPASPFFSYMSSNAPFIIFGIANMILAIVSLFGLLALYLDVYNYILTVSHGVVVGTAIVIIDAIINTILFITMRGDYINWCIDSASGRFIDATHTGDLNTMAQQQDFYNCDRSWQDELKFGVLALMMIGYWAMCFRSFRIKRAVYLSHIMGVSIDPRHVPPPMGPPMGGPMGPMRGVPPPPPPPPPMMDPRSAGHPHVIVLNNIKSSSHTKNDSPPPPPYSK
ncbi:hypothetical protein K492DRAFT_206956 [Lichtheimia hyalospora FSU 10163]|nr:hypothetical protein K492DRAFT_206956 [Lichtheimia hyalospora FSU 10163]